MKWLDSARQLVARVTGRRAGVDNLPAVERADGGAKIHWPVEGWWQMGGSVGEHQAATRFSAVFQCINLIADDIAKLPLRHYKQPPGGTRADVADSHVIKLFRKPNNYQTGYDVKKAMMVSTLWRGNGYTFTPPDDDGLPASMHVIHPNRANPQVAVNGEVFYNISLEPLELPGLEKRTAFNVPERMMMHHRTLTFRHPLNGISPLHAAAASTEIGLTILERQNAFIDNAARPSGVLTTDKVLSEEVITRFKQQWRENYRAAAAGGVAVLEEGMKWEAMSMSPDDAKLIESLGFSVEDVARAFKVPRFMLGDLNGVTYTNGETLARFYYSNCLQAHIECLEARLTLHFGLPADEWLEFDLDALLRAETATRMEAHAKGVQGGVMTPNEARAKEGLEPVDGGDTAFLQRQMVPVNVLANTTIDDLKSSTPAPKDDGDDGDDDPDPSKLAPDAWAREVSAAESQIRGLMH